MLGLELVKDTVLAHLEGEDAEVWLFGSRARHAAHRRSDIDVGILPRRTIGRAKLQRLREALDELNIPYSVDLVMLDEVPESFRKLALKDAVRWRT